MKKQSDLENYTSKQKAIDRALWLNFEYRLTNQRYVVVPSYETGYFVAPNGHSSFEEDEIEELPSGYSDMSYMDIQNIRTDCDQLQHWQEIVGMFTVMNGELLRFVLHYGVALEKLIRYELACRGHDKEHKWVGFEKAKEIWLE